MLKKVLRSTYLTKRNSLTTAKLSSDSISIANRLLALPIWHFDYYHLFLPITNKKEIDTSSILSILQGKDKHVIVPKVIDSDHLNHFLLTDSTKFKLSTWGVPEPLDGIPVSPQKLDVVFVPLLAFDRYGNRVGYGKGFYDKFLSECRKDVIKVGISFFEAENKITDVHKADIKLSYCVTPDHVYSFDAS
jgi:5-formyltetrahydrofolate cyclo-ligase